MRFISGSATALRDEIALPRLNGILGYKMKILSTVAYFALTATVSASPVKCIVKGKTIYTDDAKTCVNSNISTINGNVSIFPKVTATNNSPTSPPKPPLPNQSVSDSILQQFGMSQEDVANGWKTIMDAKQRGSWKAPETPDDDR